MNTLVYAIGRRIHPQTVRRRLQSVIEEWDTISQQFISHLMCSMRRRGLALMILNGGYTYY